MSMLRNLVFTFALLMPAWSITGQENSVTVTGLGAIVNGNIDAAKNNALVDAFRKAVEKGLGVWMKSSTQVENFATVKDEILTRSEGYVTSHTVLKEGPDASGMYAVTIEATVNVDKLGADFKQIVGRVKTEMGNPSITFVLSTYEKKGSVSSTSAVGHSNVEQHQDVQAASHEETSASGQYQASVAGAAAYSESSDQYAHGRAYTNDDGSEAAAHVHTAGSGSAAYVAGEAGQVDARAQTDYAGNSTTHVKTNEKFDNAATVTQIDENLWKKVSDATIIDAFQQEFKEKGFDLMAADKAREIALAPSNIGTDLNPFDRGAVRTMAEKEGANYVSRGEAMVIDKSESGGMRKATVKLGAEIIDVNSGDIVASYSNTAAALASDDQTAIAQAVKKCAILGARTLADQTITTWRERAANGKQFTIMLKGIKSVRSQQTPFMSAVTGNVTKIISSTSPEPGVLMIRALYKGSKDDLGNGILNFLGSKPGFQEGKFDGPFMEGGNIVFKFL